MVCIYSHENGYIEMQIGTLESLQIAKSNTLSLFQ